MHIPVLLKEAVNGLNPKTNDNFIDCTLGGGGHALEILRQTSPNGKLLGIDCSIEAINEVKDKFSHEPMLRDRMILVNDNFLNLEQIARLNNFLPVKGILFDLGLSSDLLENRGRGISFQRDEFLDMRFNPSVQKITAYEIVNSWPEDDLKIIFKQFGEERFSGRLAQTIVEKRKEKDIKTTTDLVRIIKIGLGRKFYIKSLARVFQALRIAVNNELENLSLALNQSVDLLVPGGRLAVISFHSLEDRMVKNFLKQDLRLKIINKKVIKPSREEILSNRRSRSAKLRIAERI